MNQRHQAATKKRTPSLSVEAAAMLRGILEAVDRGELVASSPSARRLIHRIEGTISGLEAVDPGAVSKSAR